MAASVDSSRSAAGLAPVPERPAFSLAVWQKAWEQWARDFPARLTQGLGGTAPVSALMPSLKALVHSLPSPLSPLSPFSSQAPIGVAPERAAQLQTQYMRDVARFWQDVLGTLADKRAKLPENLALARDRRFSSEAWRVSPGAWMAAWYLLQARYLSALAEAVEGDAKTRERIRFAVEQWIAAAAPSNYLAFNPDAQKALLESNGASLMHGLRNLFNDLSRGKITQTDASGFEVGKNLATTEGAVVFENELVQLIQYKPRAASVFERPLLIVPPCINKYYILDLQPENSLVRYALDEGFQVFMLSWRNVDASLAHKTWDDYIRQGIFEPLDAVRGICGGERVNTLGFCVGGTMLASALAALAARGEHPAASLTLLASMLDFADLGTLDIFIDEAHVRMREQTIGGVRGAPIGLMRGVDFANTFACLRPTDLVWNYVVDNYLKGRTPPAFDLLYWNSDATNLPGPMYAWYLRHCYLQNELRLPNRLTVCGTSVDLGAIEAPAFVYGSREDHIVPWRTAYESMRILRGLRRFVLGASGHIAGVINPPAKRKRSYWALDGDDAGAAREARAWFDAAQQQPGSWWPEWSAWLARHGGRRLKLARRLARLGSAAYPVIEPAPGRYVLARD